MAELKREYVIPLRQKARKAPKWRRSKKSVTVLKDFVRRHMKTDDVIICSELNEHIWDNGAKNPPGKVSVIALRMDVNGTQTTIVNLASVGIDKQRELYKNSKSKAAAVEEADVKEVETKEEASEETTEEKASEKKATSKKQTSSVDKEA